MPGQRNPERIERNFLAGSDDPRLNIHCQHPAAFPEMLCHWDEEVGTSELEFACLNGLSGLHVKYLESGRLKLA